MLVAVTKDHNIWQLLPHELLCCRVQLGRQTAYVQQQHAPPIQLQQPVFWEHSKWGSLVNIAPHSLCWVECCEGR